FSSRAARGSPTKTGEDRRFGIASAVRGSPTSSASGSSDSPELCGVRHRGLAVARRQRGASRPFDRPIAVRFFLERVAVLDERVSRSLQLHQEIAEELARRSERTWRDRGLFRRVFALSGPPHARERRGVTMLGMIEPRLRAQLLNRDLLGPVALSRCPQPLL